MKREGVTDDTQKRALLLHVAGVDVQEIYFTLVNKQESAFWRDDEGTGGLFCSQVKCAI